MAAVVLIAIVAVAIIGFATLIVMVAAGIRREDRRGAFTEQAPSLACRSARKATGVGVRWA